MSRHWFKGGRGALKYNMPKNFVKSEYEILNAYQSECAQRLGSLIQLDNIAYLLQHPEIKAMWKTCLAKVMHSRENVLADIALYFTKPLTDLDKDIRMALNISPDESYLAKNIKSSVNLEDHDVQKDILNILKKYHSDAPFTIYPTEASTPQTVSSSFISILTSESTLLISDVPTPIPEPTTSEIFYKMIVNVMDKVTYSQITDEDILYDTAYVEIMKAVENAMEIPVIEIREDMKTLIDMAYTIFECYVMDMEKRAAELAWEKRMRKKLKRTLRRQKNFKGYETPPTPNSEISSHESYKAPAPRPCKCNTQWKYNRYPKDRFGIYLPRDNKFATNNITTSPVQSMTDLTECDNENVSTKSTCTSFGK